MELRERLAEEINKMDLEIKRCYEIANKNFDAENNEMWHRWSARAEAFRDCKERLECIINQGD